MKVIHVVFIEDFDKATIRFERLMQTDKHNNNRKEVIKRYKATSYDVAPNS